MKIVPNTIRKEYELRKIGNANGWQIVTFQEFIEFLYRKLKEKKPVIHDFMEYMLVKEIRKKMGKEFGAHQMIEFIRELKQAMITPYELKEVAKKIGGHLKLIADVYERYERLKGKLGFIDHIDKERIIYENLEDLFPPDLDEIIFEGFYNPTYMQLQFIFKLGELLAKRGGRLFVRVPYDPWREDAFRFVQPVIRSFEKLGERFTAIDPNPLFEMPEEDYPEELKHIFAYIFKTPDRLKEEGFKPYKGEKSVKIIKCEGIFREVEFVARKILELIDEGYNVDDIAVIVRNMTLYGPVIDREFKKWGIPFSFRRSLPLIVLPLTKFLIELLSLPDKDFERDALRKILSSDFLKNKPSNFFIETLLLQTGYIRDSHRTFWECYEEYCEKSEIMRRRRKKADTDLEADINRREEKNCAKFIKKFIDDVKELKTNSVNKFRKKFYEIVDKYKVFEGKDAIAVENIMNVFERILLSYRLFNYDFELQDFVDTLSYALKDISLPSDWHKFDGVKVLNVYDAVGLRFKVVFCIGLNDGVFPEKHYESPYLADEVKEEINRIFKRNVFSTSKRRHQEEPLLFYFALLTAREKVFLTYSSVDSEGRPLLPSGFIEAVLRLREDKEEDDYMQFAYVPSIDKAFCKDDVEKNLCYLHGEYGKIFEFQNVSEIIKRANRENVARIPLDMIKIEELSASDFDNLVQCKFKFYMRKLMKIKEPLIAEPSMRLIDRGSIIHEVLNECRDMIGEDFDEDELKKVIDKKIEEAVRDRIIADKYLLSSQVERILPLLIQFLIEEKRRRYRFPFKVIATEKWFEEKFEFDGRKIKLKGKVDRIDEVDGVYGRGIQIIDYKHSLPRAGGRIWKEMTQPDVYLYLLSKAYPGKKLNFGFYFIHDDGIKLKLLSDGFVLDSQIEEAKDKLQNYMRLIFSGEYPADCEDEYRCRGCPYKNICRSQR